MTAAAAIGCGSAGCFPTTLFSPPSQTLTARIIKQIDQLVRRDPADRGLIGSEPLYGPLCEGHLAAAAAELAASAVHVAIVTGFYVPHGNPPSAETDGPPGSLMLARALEAGDVDVTLLTDSHCVGAVTATAEAAGFATERVVTVSDEKPGWVHEFFTTGPGHTLTHLIAIERVGPAHTPESLCAQSRLTETPLEDFIENVPAESHGRCHNMRGRPIDEYTGELHRLFEELPRYRPEARTIGIGDGANEIGMGSIPWEDLCRRLEGGHAGRIPCRIETDWTIVAGTSNWGAYALAAATLLLRDQTDLLAGWDAPHQQRVLEYLVEHGPAVDGATGRREPTVDGLPFLTYIQPWEGIRRLLGLQD